MVALILMSALFAFPQELSPAVVSTTRKRLTLKVMTWNIHNGKNESGKETISQVENVILAVNPDILILNEANYLWSFSKESNIWIFPEKKDLAKEIASDCKFPYYYEPRKKTEAGYWYYVVAIFSKFLMSEQENIELPRIENNNMIRVLASANLYLEGKKIKVFGTHLAPYHEGRIKQVKVVKRKAKESKLPVI